MEKHKLSSVITVFLICYVCWNFLLYTIFAFILWTADPSRWEQTSRLGLALLGLLMGAIFSTVMTMIAHRGGSNGRSE